MGRTIDPELLEDDHVSEEDERNAMPVAVDATEVEDIDWPEDPGWDDADGGY